MSIEVFDKGAVVRLSMNFQDSTGTDVDPTTIALTVTDPAGTSSNYTYAASDITRASTGNYHIDVDADAEGDWFFRWVSTGTGAGAKEGQFVVQPTMY